jgi:hypothetical protein
VERAKSVGLPDGESAESYNSSAIEVLRQLPGITSYNWKKVIKGVTNLSELAGMSEVLIFVFPFLTCILVPTYL